MFSKLLNVMSIKSVFWDRFFTIIVPLSVYVAITWRMQNAIQSELEHMQYQIQATDLISKKNTDDKIDELNRKVHEMWLVLDYIKRREQ